MSQQDFQILKEQAFSFVLACHFFTSSLFFKANKDKGLKIHMAEQLHKLQLLEITRNFRADDPNSNLIAACRHKIVNRRILLLYF